MAAWHAVGSHQEVDSVIQTVLPVQNAVPAAFLAAVEALRRQHAAVLDAAARGDFDIDRLQDLSRRIGRLLAREAKKPAAERGCRMIDLSLAVHRLFPELAGWSQVDVERSARKAVRRLPAAMSRRAS